MLLDIRPEAIREGGHGCDLPLDESDWAGCRSWRVAGGLAVCLAWALVLAACRVTGGSEPRRGQEEKIAASYASVEEVVDALRQAGVPCEPVGTAALRVGQCQVDGSTLTIHMMRPDEQLAERAAADELTYWVTGPNWAAYSGSTLPVRMGSSRSTVTARRLRGERSSTPGWDWVVRGFSNFPYDHVHVVG